jgi:hypothetical protein
MQRRLTRAGIRHESAIAAVYGAKLLLGLSLGVFAFLLVAALGARPESRLGAIMLGSAAGSAKLTRISPRAGTISNCFASLQTCLPFTNQDDEF